LLDAAYIDHNPIPAPAPGLEGFQRRLAIMRSVFSDLVLTVDDLLAEGEQIAFRWTFRGRHTGTIAGRPPTDKLVTFAGINIEYLVAGKIVEHWSVFDLQNLLQQLGVAPSIG
jgi:predicted ester cyclase